MVWLGLGIGLLTGVIGGSTALAIYAYRMDRRRSPMNAAWQFETTTHAPHKQEQRR